MIVVVSQAGYQKEHHLLQYHPAGEEQLWYEGRFGADLSTSSSSTNFYYNNI